MTFKTLNLLVICIGFVFAADWYVSTSGSTSSNCGQSSSSPCKYLQLAVDQISSNGDVIHVDDGIYPFCEEYSSMNPQYSISIIGTGNVTFDGDFKCPFLNISISSITITLNQIILTRFQSPIYSIGNLIIQNSHFRNCTSSMTKHNYFGIIFIEQTQQTQTQKEREKKNEEMTFLILTNTYFIHNSYNSSSSTYLLPINGLCVSASNINLNVTDSHFHHNSISSFGSSVNGVGIYCISCTSNIVSSSFHSNSIYVGGENDMSSTTVSGASMTLSGSTNVSNCVFVNNSVSLELKEYVPFVRGAIFSLADVQDQNVTSVSFQNCSFHSNRFLQLQTAAEAPQKIVLVEFSPYGQTFIDSMSMKNNFVSSSCFLDGHTVISLFDTPADDEDEKHIRFGQLTIINSEFVSNIIAPDIVDGGNCVMGNTVEGVHFAVDHLFMSNVTFQNCIIESDSGLIEGGTVHGLLVVGSTTAQTSFITMDSNYVKGGDGKDVNVTDNILPGRGGNVQALLAITEDCVNFVLNGASLSNNVLRPGLGGAISDVSNISIASSGLGFGVINCAFNETTILNTFFYNNSLHCPDSRVSFVPQLQGSALSVIGGNSSFQNCTFDSNSVFGGWVSGGAAYVTNNAKTRFVNCTFQSNFANTSAGLKNTSQGGALMIQNSNVSCYDCIFQQNFAQSGIIYIGVNGAFHSTASSYVENDAWYGGVFFQDSNSTLKFEQDDKHPQLVKNNTALQTGGVLFLLHPTSSVFPLSLCYIWMNDNFASSGQGCASPLSQILLHNSTSLEQTPGVDFNLTYIVLDTFNNTMKNSDVQVRVQGDDWFRSGSTSQIQTPDKYTGLVMFMNAAIYAAPNSTEFIHAEIVGSTSVFVDVNFEMLGCDIFDYLDNLNTEFICTHCKAGTYAYGPTNTECETCPEGLNCSTSPLQSQKDYWCYSLSQSIECIYCPKGRCCAEDDGCSWNRSCSGNRGGVFCSDCLSGFSESATTAGCVDTSLCNEGSLTLVLVQAGVIELFVPILPMFLFGSASDGSMTALISYLQLLPLVVRDTVFDQILQAARLEMSSVYSVLHWNQESCLAPNATAILKALSNIFAPALGFADLAIIAIISGISVLTGLHAKILDKLVQLRTRIAATEKLTKKTRAKLWFLNSLESVHKRMKVNKEVYASIALMLIIALFVPILNTVASLVSCVEYTDESGNVDLRLLVYAKVHCYSNTEQKIALAALVLLCLFPAGVFIVHFRLRKMHQNNRKVAVEYLHALQGGYKETRWWWETVSSYRRLALVMLNVFLNGYQITRGCSIALISLLALAIHLFFRPYISFKNQVLEAGYLLSLTVIAVLQIVPSALQFYGIEFDSSTTFYSFLEYAEPTIISIPLLMFLLATILPPILPLISTRLASKLDLEKQLMVTRDSYMPTNDSDFDDPPSGFHDDSSAEGTRLLVRSRQQ